MGVVTFAGGVDSMSIPAGTTEVVGNGDVDTVDLSATYAYSWNFEVVANSDGTYSVTDLHTGNFVDTVFSGISFIKFTDKTVSLASLAAPASSAVASGSTAAASTSHVVTFASGVNTMTIPAGTVKVVGNGATDTIDLSQSYSWNFSIAPNSDGSFSLTDIHAGSLTNTMLTGIADIKFEDKTVSLASLSQVVTFASGVTTMVIPAGTTKVVGNGATDTIDLGGSYSWNYAITANSDGTFSLTDVHGGTLTNTVLTGIADIKFSDKTVALTPPLHIVTFAAGVNTMPVPNGTVEVIGNGAADTIDLGSAYSWNYSLVHNGNGSYSLTDTHGGTLNKTLLVEIANLRFEDKTIALTPATNMVTFAPGVNTMSIPSGTQEVVGNGAADTIDLSGNYSWNYSVVHNADRSYSLTDTHGGTLTDTLLVGITNLKFSDGTLALATNTISSGASSSSSSSSSGGSTSVTSGGTPSTPSPTIHFAAGADILTVPSGTGAVVGNGDAQDVAVFAYEHDWYTITAESGGAAMITDIHTGSVTNLTTSGVAILKFSDGWNYQVSAGNYIPVLATNTVGQSELYAPTLSTGSVASAITSVQIENPTQSPLAARTLTFGEVFADKDLPSAGQLIAIIGGKQVAVQVDAKTFYADGSVDLAELTLAAPALAAGQSTQVVLSKAAAATPAAAAINPSKFASSGYDTNIALTFHNSDGSTSTTTINAASVLALSLASNTATTWLSGPLATEVQVNAPVNGSMHLLLNIRANADGTFSTDVQFQNDAIFSSSAQSYTYDVAITSHGQTAFAQAGITQAPMQEWHTVVASTATGVTTAPADFIAYDVPYLEKTGAVPSYDTSTGVSANTIQGDYVNLGTTNTGVLGSAQVVTYEPTSGARPDIGPTTQWGADWLVSQNSGAEALMLANAAAGAEPIHAANPDGSVATAASDPNLWLDSRATGANAATNNFGTVETAAGWTLDPAHMPDLSYFAALTQGSEYYIAQVQDQANYDILSLNPGYRSDAAGIFIDTAQVRGSAWTLRDVLEAAYVTPSSDPLKAYFAGIVENNINQILTEYVHGSLGAGEGALQGYILGGGSGTTAVAPWQEAYLAIEIANAAKLGFAGAAEVAAWQNNFITGLFLNGANGFNPLEGTAQWLSVVDTSSAGGSAPITSWAQLYSDNFGTTVPTQLDGYPNDPVGGYPAIMKAALASLWDVTHNPDDLAAYAYLTRLTPSLISSTNSYAQSQTFDITPTLLDGHHLQNSEVYYASGGTTTAATANGLLAAASGNNVLNAGSGDSILIGGTGSDTLNGGAGDDVLIAGDGTQTLYGGGGSNYMRGGHGADKFIVNLSDAAHDTIVGFKLGTDSLSIVTGGKPLAALALIAGATLDAQGDAVLHLSASHDVTLVGISLGQLTTALLSIT